MAQTNYINFADYLDINQDEIRRMEEAMRAEEQRRLAEAVNATNAAGQGATEAAYWGEGGADLMEYGDYQKALSKQEAAKRWQDALKTDKGQQELLTKLYGSQASALEAGLLFGSQEGGQKTKLGEYMGIDSSEFERDLNANWANELKGSKAAWDREAAAKADWKQKKAAYDAWTGGKASQRGAYVEDVYRQIEKHMTEGQGWRDPGLARAWAAIQSEKRPAEKSALIESMAAQMRGVAQKNKAGIGFNIGAKKMGLPGEYVSDYDTWFESKYGQQPDRVDPYSGRSAGTREDWKRSHSGRWWEEPGDKNPWGVY